VFATLTLNLFRMCYVATYTDVSVASALAGIHLNRQQTKTN